MTATKYEGVQRWLPAVGLDSRDDREYSFAKMVKHPGGDQGIAYVTHADYKALSMELARYKADAERLDWAESKFNDGVHIEGCFSRSYSGANLRPCASVFYGPNVAQATTLRDALDIARNAPKEG